MTHLDLSRHHRRPSYEAINADDPAHHTWDNGRRYHQYCRDQSPYYLPDDKAEQDRMYLLHYNVEIGAGRQIVYCTD